jgi:hypothetical protein
MHISQGRMTTAEAQIRDQMRITESSIRPSEEKDAATQEKIKPIRCNLEHCGLPAVASLTATQVPTRAQFFCLPHFIEHCYEALRGCNPSQFPSPDSAAFESENRFLDECAEQAALLVCPLRGFDNLDRARLFDIFLWASELTVKRAVFAPSRAEESQASRSASAGGASST